MAFCSMPLPLSSEGSHFPAVTINGVRNIGGSLCTSWFTLCKRRFFKKPEDSLLTQYWILVFTEWIFISKVLFHYFDFRKNNTLQLTQCLFFFWSQIWVEAGTALTNHVKLLVWKKFLIWVSKTYRRCKQDLFHIFF